MPRLKKSEVREEVKEDSAKPESVTVFAEGSKAPFIPKTRKQECMDRLKPVMDEELKKVKGRFRNFENPGAMASIYVRKYPGVEDFKRDLMDGEVYEIPLYVARFLNGVDILAKEAQGRINTCAYPTHGFKWDEGKPAPGCTGGEGGIPVPIVTVAKYNKRFGFESLEFDSAAAA